MAHTPDSLPSTLESVAAVPAERLHALALAAFADYLAGPLVLPLAQWSDFLARQGVDPDLSRVACQAGRALAFVLVAPRPALNSWRVAMMGARPEARGSGAARSLLADVLARARAAGVAALELEVFAQNAPALALYQRQGFVARHALYGYEFPGDWAPEPQALATGLAPHEVGAAEARAWLLAAEQAVPGLPLQVGPAATTGWEPAQAAGPGWRCWQWRPAPDAPALAQLLVAPGPGRTQVRSLIDRSEGQVATAALLATAHRACSGGADAAAGAVWQVPALQREDLGGQALARAGAHRQALHQWWMQCRL